MKTEFSLSHIRIFILLEIFLFQCFVSLIRKMVINFILVMCILLLLINEKFFQMIISNHCFIMLAYFVSFIYSVLKMLVNFVCSFPINLKLVCSFSFYHFHFTLLK